jgi:hypothetical protein
MLERIMKTHFAYEDSPVTGARWKKSSESDRIGWVVSALKHIEAYSDLEVINAPKDGRVVVRTLRAIPANERGLFFLEMEAMLKDVVDQGITIWCEPVGDKSKLRKLRGVNFANLES